MVLRNPTSVNLKHPTIASSFRTSMSLTSFHNSTVGGHRSSNNEHGLSSGAARSAIDQMKSSVFDVDPSCQGITHDDGVQAKPHNRDQRFLQNMPPQPPPGMFLHRGAAPSPPRPTLAEIGRSPTKSSVDIRPPDNAPDPQHVEMVLESLRVALRRRGAEGIQGLARNFKICDTNRSGKLDTDEVRKCLRLCQIQLEEDDFEALLAHLDSDNDREVDYDEFLKAVRGRMPASRRKLVVSVFGAIDANGKQDGNLDIEDIKGAFDAKMHPEVKAGKRSESSVLTEMLTNFEGKRGNRDGTVTLEEWVAYYEELSASIEHDDHFTLMVTGAWSNLFPPMGGLALPVPKATVDQLEKVLKEAIRTRSTGTSETKAVEKVFRDFDADNSRCVSFDEFCKAMERFGLSAGGSCTTESILALFERYDPDGSGELSYDEFVKGLYKLDAPPPTLNSARGAPPVEHGTSLPLPSERGEGRRPNPANPLVDGQACYARGRGGMLNGGFNQGISMPTPPSTAGAGGRSQTVNGFNKSSGIFR